MIDRKRSLIRRANIELNRRNSEASALRQLRVVIRKLSRAVRADKPIMLLPSEADTIVRFYKIATSRRGVVGAPELLAEFHRWMARDVYWRRDGGATVKAANSEVAEEWQVSVAMVQKVVQKYGSAAQDWLKKFGADRESTAVLIAMRAHGFRMLAIERKREEEPTQRARRVYERTSGGRMQSLPPGMEDNHARAVKIAAETRTRRSRRNGPRPR